MKPEIGMTRLQRKYRRFPRFMHLERLWKGINYEKEMELLYILCDSRKTSVDVGAKLGMYSHRLLRHSRNVVAVEPIPLLVYMLECVFRWRRCRILPCALSHEAGRALLRVPYGSDGEVKFGRSTIEEGNKLVHNDIASVEEVEVDVTTLDQHSLTNVGFIKIDVEGHELAVLKGADETLLRECPNLLIEANSHHYPNAVSELHRFLAGFGYQGVFWGPEGLMDYSAIADERYFRSESIENFIFIHESNPGVRTLLAEHCSRA